MIFHSSLEQGVGKGVSLAFSESGACCVSGVESSAAAAGPLHPPARHQRRDAEAAKPTQRQEGEAGSGSFSLAGDLRQDWPVPGQHIPVTVDVHVRHRPRLYHVPARLQIQGKMARDWFPPFFARESSDVSRLPRWIYNAECLTSGCLSLQGDGEDASLEAKPIYYQTLVLHR